MRAKEYPMFFPPRQGLFALAISISICAQAADDAVVVTATRFPERELGIPIGVTIIRADRISAHTARTLPDLLAQEAGITTRDSSGSPDRQIDMRGFGVTGDQNTLVLLNGQRLTEIELTPTRWSAIPLDSIERIEIMRGSGAVLYGGGATGGTINIVTKDAAYAPAKGKVVLSTGSFDAKELQGALSTGVAGLSLAMNFTDYSSNNYRANNRVEQNNVSGELRADGDRGHATFRFAADSQSLRLPGERTYAELGSNPRGTRRPGDYSSLDGHRASLGGALHLGQAEVAVELGYRDSARTALLRDYTFGVFDTYTDTRTRVWSLTPRLRMPLDAWGYSTSLVAGLDLDDWDYESRRSASMESLSAPTARVIADQKNTALYFQSQTAIGARTKLSLGYRQQRMRMSAVDRINPAAYANGSRVRRPTAWEVALRQEFFPSTAAFARTGQSFRFSTVDEVYSQFGGPAFDSMITLLEPQRSRDNELGVEFRKGTLRSRASLYSMNLENEIYFFFPAFANINLPPTRRKGLELDAAWEASRSIALTANMTLARARFRSGVIGGFDVSGKHVPLVPDTLANAGMTLRIDDRWKLGVSAKHVGKQYYDNDQLNSFPSRMPAFNLLDLRLSHERKEWTVSVSANNILNKQYYTYAIRNGAGDSFNAYPQAGRHFLATLQVRMP
jgi:iron complex outermembrane receptor protein